MRLTIKAGGSILEDATIRAGVIAQVARLAPRHEILLVHGGGKSLNRRLGELGIPSRFVEGLRVTDEATLRVAIMVLAGEVNKRLVAELARAGLRPVGLCGADGLCVRCRPMKEIPGAPPDLGFVGKAIDVEASFLGLLTAAGLVPTIASLALGPDFRPYNVNADQMASAVAGGTGSRRLIYLTDVAGVLDGEGKVIPRMGRSDVLSLRSRGAISGGMLPKTDACLEALERGVESVRILPGADPGALWRSVEQDTEEGTSIHG